MRFPVFSAGVGLLIAVLPGCHDAAHDAVIQQRVDGMNRTINAFEDMESRRPENLARTVDAADELYRHDLEKTRENPGLVDKAAHDEFQRFHDRQPEYRRRADELLRGNPENIKKTLPHMIY